MKLCQERADHEEQRKTMEAEVEKMQEQQQEQQDKLSELIDKVNDQARMVGEMQQNPSRRPQKPTWLGYLRIPISVAYTQNVSQLCPKTFSWLVGYGVSMLELH